MALIDPTRLTDAECLALVEHLGLPLVSLDLDGAQIGRASCRERVCTLV